MSKEEFKSFARLHPELVRSVNEGKTSWQKLYEIYDTINIDKDYRITLPLSEEQNVECGFSPIRIEKNNEGGYTISGRFDYNSSKDKMTLTQYCAKRSIEIKNK